VLGLNLWQGIKLAGLFILIVIMALSDVSRSKGPFIIYILGGEIGGGGGSCKVHLVLWGCTCFFLVLGGVEKELKIL
jgi:hypothetical protein